MRREVRWERMFPDELEAAIAECPAVYLSYGLCEPHGPQNALGMDGLRPHAAACRAARKFGGIVAPPEFWHCHGYGIYAAWAHPIIGDARPWLTCVPPWVFLRNLCYHVRAADALGFHAIVIFSGHAGPHSADVKTLLQILQPHVAARIGHVIGLGTTESRFADGKGMGGHAGRGETSLLWAVEPDCVDLSRVPAPDAPGPHFAMGQHVPASDRRTGERMTDDIVEWLGAVAKRLLAEYGEARPEHTPLTYGDIERIWATEVRPRFSEFSSMKDLAEGQEPPPPDSPWHANWRVPDLP